MPFQFLRAAIVVLLVAHPAAWGAPRQDDAIESLLLRLNAGRGVAGSPLSSETAPAIADPQASELAAKLQGLRRANRVAAPAPMAQDPAAAGAAEPRPRQALAIHAFRATVDPAVQVHRRAENGTIRQIRGGALAPAATGRAKAGLRERDENTAQVFLREHADLLGVSAPDREFVIERSALDGAGGRLVRFAQRHGGLPVWPASVSVHLDPKGQVTGLEGAYVPTPQGVAVTPKITAEEAVFLGKASVPSGKDAEAGDVELVVFAPLTVEPRLAWRFELNLGLAQAWLLLVDATDGRLLRRSNQILDANVSGTGADLDGVNRSLNVWQAGASYYLVDTSKPMFRAGTDPIQQPQGVIAIADARLQKVDDLRSSEVVHITATNPNQWPIPDGVSAAFNFSHTYDYFFAEHGRNSLDGEGGNITAVVRVGEYNNASWHGNLKLMLFGNVQPFAGALDVVGHELTHGVTENSAGLVYENQSGALNESFSDIFGEMVEARVVGQADWKMGTKLAHFIRDFKDPGSLIIQGLNRPFPSRMSEFIDLPNTDDADHGGVHLNSSIINHAFWLLAEGLPGAIGRHDAERIFFRCLTQHLQPQSQFIDARLGCLAAAENLFGRDSTQARKVAEAFDGVEIFTAPESPEPTPVPVVQGPDSTLFIGAEPFLGDLTLFRLETAQGDQAFGSTFSDSVRLTRPAVTGDGSITLFVNSEFDLCVAETANASTRQCLGYAGRVHAVAMSPDGRFGAFVLRNSDTQQPENRISIINLENSTTQTYELLAPTVDGVPIDAVLYADSMAFSTDSQILYYDALSRLRFGTGPTVERWSIYALHLDTGKISIVVPPIEGVDTGNPSMGRAGNRYLVFDAAVESVGNSAIIVLDLFTGAAGRLGVVEGGFGYPSFLGDESAVIFAQSDPTAFGTGFSLVRQDLSSDRLQAVGDPSLWMYDAVVGVIYRRGAFSGTNAPPTVTLALSAPGPTIPAGSVVSLNATAADSDGAIGRVEFFDGDERVGDDATPPYGITWTATAAGTHRLIARAIDNLGAASDSAPVVVSVSGQGGSGNDTRLTIARQPDGSMRLAVRAPAGSYIISQSVDLREWADIYPVAVDASGEGVVLDAGGPMNNLTLFYRARRE